MEGSELRQPILDLLSHPQFGDAMPESRIVQELNRHSPPGWDEGAVRVAVDRMASDGLVRIELVRGRIRLVMLRGRVALRKSKHAPQNVDWTEELIAKLGTMSDAKLAKEIGVGSNTVFWKRTHLGIPAFQKTPRAKKTG
jgi:hypothetical protein